MLLRGWLPSAIAALALASGAGIFCLHRQASAVVGGTEASAPRRIFTSEEIIEFQNKTGQHLLIVVGQVFNVTSGTEFYGVGQGYEGFVSGHDASRAFLTADFERNATDDLTDLTLQQCHGVNHWLNFYHNHSTYTFQGLHAGRYYDASGNSTEELREFQACCRESQAVSIEMQKIVEPAPRCQRTRDKEKKPGIWYIYECPDGLVPHQADLPDMGELCSCLATPVPVPAPWGDRRINDIVPAAYTERCEPSSNSSTCTIKVA